MKASWIAVLFASASVAYAGEQPAPKAPAPPGARVTHAMNAACGPGCAQCAAQAKQVSTTVAVKALNAACDPQCAQCAAQAKADGGMKAKSRMVFAAPVRTMAFDKDEDTDGVHAFMIIIENGEAKVIEIKPGEGATDDDSHAMMRDHMRMMLKGMKGMKGMHDMKGMKGMVEGMRGMKGMKEMHSDLDHADEALKDLNFDIHIRLDDETIEKARAAIEKAIHEGGLPAQAREAIERAMKQLHGMNLDGVRERAFRVGPRHEDAERDQERVERDHPRMLRMRPKAPHSGTDMDRNHDLDSRLDRLEQRMDRIEHLLERLSKDT